MKRITGIKSVDFKIIAGGHGVVNWNGSTEVAGPDGVTVKNHALPKLRGFSPFNGRVKAENGYRYRKSADDINLAETPLYISANCLRHHLFKDHAMDMHQATAKNIDQILATYTGLIRGYMVPDSGLKRESALFVEDLVDTLGNGNFEQFGRAGSRDSASFYSKVTFGDTQYIGYGSISIENLQFISLDPKFDKAAAIIREGEGEKLAQSIQDYIQSIDADNDPKVTFHPNYVRNGRIFNDGEAGLVLNEGAIQALVWITLEMIQELGIRQGKGDMYVDEIIVDYNDSNKPMRIKRDENDINEDPESPYAQYYRAVEVDKHAQAS